MTTQEAGPTGGMKMGSVGLALFEKDHEGIRPIYGPEHPF